MGTEPTFSVKHMLTPEETDRCLASLPESVTRCIAASWDNDRGLDGQFESTFVGYEILPGAPKDDIKQALAIVTRACAPAPPEIIGAELQLMHALTKSRPEPTVDAQFQAAAMFDHLSAYPADVVVDACRARSARETFFPSWAELKGELDRRMQRRLALKRALEA